MPSDEYELRGPDEYEICPTTCGGSGEDDDGEDCRYCEGSGLVLKD